MKHVVLITALWAGAAQADSLCGVTDEATIRATLAGEWAHRGAGAYLTASVEQTGPIEGVTRISRTGRFLFSRQNGGAIGGLPSSTSPPS